MTSNRACGRQDPRTWAELREKVITAADAKLEQAIRDSKGIELPGQPVPWDSTSAELSLVVGAVRGVYWKELRYFLVDEALDAKRPENRHVAEYRAYHSRQGRLRLTVPSEAQEGLRDARRVRVFRVDQAELTFAQRWKSALDEMDRGPRVLDLWSTTPEQLVPWAPDHLPPDEPLNPGQQNALAAMTTAGGFFVWGPPGTGKTKVIISAVHRALTQGRSVLVTSHTHVAVDNVLSGLVEADSAYGLDIMRPGRVIRHGNAEKVLPEVRDHRFLLLEKAAAVMTELEVRQKDLDDELRRNTGHPDRGRERETHDHLIRQGVDIDRVRTMRALEPERVEFAAVTSRLGELGALSEQLDGEIGGLSNDMETFAGLDRQIETARRDRAGLEDAASRWTVYLRQREEELTAASHELDAARARQEAAELRMYTRAARWFPWVASNRKLASLEADARVSDLLADQQSAHAALRQAESALRHIAGELEACASREDPLERSRRRREEIRAELEARGRRRRSVLGESRELRERARELDETTGGSAAQYAESRVMRGSGHWDLVGDFDELLARVEELDEDRREIEKRIQRLEDEFRQHKSELLSTASVVATTLSALSFNHALHQRRFDVVIIDEAASAEAPAIVYAAAKADTTLAIVGDFLQNAPIAETDDAENAEQLEVVQWQTSDIFGLAGITDRASATQHPRCVAISRQYRYPPIIADLVNDFCYDGLLESHQKEDLSGQPVISFLDTSSLRDRGFTRTRGSWRCERTVDAAAELAAGICEGTIGYVTPYAPQASAAQRAFRAAGLDIEAGTSHRFQGREFDTVIVDLMQDERPRWVSAADLHGAQRAVSAAKLLNVALTRAKKKLYLIGDWNFVRGHDSPGMRALASLEARANFEVRDIAHGGRHAASA